MFVGGAGGRAAGPYETLPFEQEEEEDEAETAGGGTAGAARPAAAAARGTGRLLKTRLICVSASGQLNCVCSILSDAARRHHLARRDNAIGRGGQ